MKILIVSDTHFEEKGLKDLNRRYDGVVDMKIHCGDSQLPPNCDTLKGYSSVRGNCDLMSKFPEQLVIEENPYRIFVAHGHHQQVKYDMIGLQAKAREEGANIVCFGHSHILGVEEIEGVLFLNPGSLSRPVGRKEKTYLILELLDDKQIVTVYDDGHNVLYTFNFTIFK